jgi:hypothetical protein
MMGNVAQEFRVLIFGLLRYALLVAMVLFIGLLVQLIRRDMD